MNEKPDDEERVVADPVSDSEQISATVYEAFELLGANDHVVNFMAYIVSKESSTLEEIPIPFNRRIKSLEYLKSKGWVEESHDRRGKIYKPNELQFFLHIDEEINKRQAEIKKFEATKKQFEIISQKDMVIGLKTHEEFYEWQSRACREARESILAVTDRFKLAWLRRDDIKHAIEANGVRTKIIGRIINKETAKRAKDLMKTGAEVGRAEKVIIRFMVVDEEIVFFAIRDPKNPDFHIGTMMRNKSFAANLVEEMNNEWEKATDPKVSIKRYLKKK